MVGSVAGVSIEQVQVLVYICKPLLFVRRCSMDLKQGWQSTPDALLMKEAGLQSEHKSLAISFCD